MKTLQTILPGLFRHGASQRTLAIGAGVLLLFAILGLFTDVFRSSRSVLNNAAEQAFAPGNRTVTAQLIIGDPGASGPKQRLRMSAKGVIADENGRHVMINGRGTTRIRKPGVEIIFNTSFRAADGAFYLQFSELPPLEGIGERLRGVWLQLSDKKSDPPQELRLQDRRTVARTLFSRDLVERIESAGRETVNDVSVRTYRVVLRKEKTREALLALADGKGDLHGGVRDTARTINGLLERFDIADLRLSVTPRRHDLVRAIVVLKPIAKNGKKGNAGDPVSLVVTVLPLTENPSPVTAPEKAQRLSRPHVLLGLLGLAI